MRLSVSRRNCVVVSQADSMPRVLILGGTGRVGGSTAAAMKRSIPGVKLLLAGRTRRSYDDCVKKFDLADSRFLQLDREDATRLKEAMTEAELVIHAAGPFQRMDRCHVLEAAIETRTPYLDVCDDTATSQMAKQLHPVAKEKGVPAIIGGGVYPGLSNVMAAHIISTNRKEYDENGEHKKAEDTAVPSVDRVRYAYFTAGSGGAGKTLMITSFMLLGEPVVAFRDGRPVIVPAMSQPTTIDFGPGVGRKGGYLLNLPEVISTQMVFDVKNVSARFGTAPALWNWILWGMARWVDDAILRDRDQMSTLASLTLPLTRLVDRAVGETVAIRIDVEFDDATSASGIYIHDTLSLSLGICIAAFANRLLNKDTQPGVWFPEEKGAMKNRRTFLQEASQGCRRLILNRPGWQIESDPQRIGLGMYYY